METDPQIKIRNLTSLDYQNSFVQGVSWGLVVLLLIIVLCWLVSIMRHRKERD